MSGQSLIIIQGGSATGKSTLARKLSADLHVHLISKDYFKEMFYDQLGVPSDRDESLVFGRAATAAIYATTGSFLDSGRDVIIESTFDAKFAQPDFEELLKGRDVKALQLYCTASPKVRLQRYNSRIESGERHPGHPDGVGMASVEEFVTDTLKYSKLDVGKTIEINTDDFQDDDYQQLLKSIKTEIGDHDYEATN